MGHGPTAAAWCGLLLLGVVAGPVAAADLRTSFTDDFSTRLGGAACRPALDGVASHAKDLFR